jgi:putative NADH-flavin reductase
MIRIAILGSNGQVGAEVAAYLSLKQDVDVLCLVRSVYSAALFRVLAIPYAVFDPSKGNALSELLCDRDIVVDCTYPGAELPDIAQTIRRNMRVVFQSMRQGSTYIYMSSIMAFGMANGVRFVKRHAWCRTSYAYIKRSAEHHAQQAGRKHNIRVFNLRLGQVHGLLQGVTQEFKTSLKRPSLVVEGDRSDLTTSVFAYPVSQAILNCGSGLVQPGLHTVVSSPQWTLGELFDYYLARYPACARIRFGEPDETSGPQAAETFIGKALVSKRDLLEAYVLLRFPSLFEVAKGSYRKRVVASDIGLLGQTEERVVSPLLGLVPGSCVADIGSSAEEVMQAEITMSDVLERSIALNRA